jgi:hypothetical protein
VLTLQNHVSLSALTTIGSLTAGSLKARAWDTLRAVVQGVAPTRAVAPMRRNVASVRGGAAMHDGAYGGGIAPTRGLASNVDQGMPRIMSRGLERC